MKMLLRLIIIITIGTLELKGQVTTLLFDYDASGNQVKRYLPGVGRANLDKMNDAKKDSLLSDSLVFKIYPNPVILSYINIDIFGGNEEEAFKMQLLDVNGKCILSGNLLKGNQQLNTSQLSNGSYILMIYNDKLNKRWKLIK